PATAPAASNERRCTSMARPKAAATTSRGAATSPLGTLGGPGSSDLTGTKARSLSWATTPLLPRRRTGLSWCSVAPGKASWLHPFQVIMPGRGMRSTGGCCRTIASMAYDEDLAARIGEVGGGEPDLTERKMFGGLAFLIGGNMAVAASGQGGVLVRADPAQSDS